MTSLLNCTKEIHTSLGDVKFVLISFVLNVINLFQKTKPLFVVTVALTGMILVALNYLKKNSNIFVPMNLKTGFVINVKKIPVLDAMEAHTIKPLFPVVHVALVSTSLVSNYL